MARGRQENGDQPMVVATASPDGLPAARWVLLKEIDDRGFVFYTNMKSRKGRDLTANPRCELALYWPALGAQLRVSGGTETVDVATADAYWRTRGRESQLASAASPQSTPITKEDLLARVEELRRECEGKEVPRPAWWTGVRVLPAAIEFWTAGEFRLHDREYWRRVESDLWEGTSLAP